VKTLNDGKINLARVNLRLLSNFNLKRVKMNYVETEIVRFIINFDTALMTTEKAIFNHDHISCIKCFIKSKIISEKFPKVELSEITIDGEKIIINATFEDIKAAIHMEQQIGVKHGSNESEKTGDDRYLF